MTDAQGAEVAWNRVVEMRKEIEAAERLLLAAVARAEAAEAAEEEWRERAISRKRTLARVRQLAEDHAGQSVGQHLLAILAEEDE